ncbi:MAG: formylglycine-generating enzyme family protein, partial [Gemmatimonadota bacterium]
TVALPGGATMDFVWVEPGTFMMGSPASEPGRFDDEGPQHEVTITEGFWLGKVEVTQGQWESAMGASPWAGRVSVREDADRPAVYVSWKDVQGLVVRLNTSEGAAAYRLPTEAEWEYACRAGTTTRWSFGGDEARIGDYAWFAGNAWAAGLEYAQPVGVRRPNRWGLYDMHGNVGEWVQDRFGHYSAAAQVDPVGPMGDSGQVARGGGFDDGPDDVRSAKRHLPMMGTGHPAIGARLVRTK